MGIKTELLHEAQRRGYSLPEIARLTGMSRQQVHQFVKSPDAANTTVNRLMDLLNLKLTRRDRKKGAANEQ